MFDLVVLADSLKRPSKRQLMAIWIENVERAFAPRCIPRDFRIKPIPFQMTPEGIHIGDVEDYAAPPRHALALFEVKDGSF